MFKVLLGFLAIVSGGAVAQPAADPRASEGPAVFFNLCVSTVSGVETPIQVDDFRFTKLDAKTFKRTRPDEKGPYWDVTSLKSGMRALVQLWSNGNCSVEITQASETETRSSFNESLQAFVLKISGKVERLPDSITQDDGRQRTESKWRVISDKGNFLFGLITYPTDKYMTQHMMIVKKVA